MKNSKRVLFSNKFLSHENFTNDYIFKGKSIQEKNGKVNYMSITTEDEFFDYSVEELRLADYKQKQEGNNIIKNEDIIQKSSILTEINNKEDEDYKNQNIFSFQGEGNDLNTNNSQEKSCLSTYIEDTNNQESNSIQSDINNNNEEDNKKKGKSLFDNLFLNKKNIKTKPRNNNNNLNQKITKCSHQNNFVSYCLDNSKNEGGLLCYECFYKYHNDHSSKCIPIKNNNFENFKNYYKETINKFKNKVKKKFDEIISEIEKLLNENIENISTLFEEKVDLDFELPIEVPFIDRFQIAINDKIQSIVDDLWFDREINPKCLNLFQNNLNELKFSNKNPNYFENIELKSYINFNLLGIGIPKIPENNENSVEVKIYKGHLYLGKITKFENFENLSIGYFDNSTIIDIENFEKYKIEIKGLVNSDYINNEELYNGKSEIKINSSNPETALSCLIIE